MSPETLARRLAPFRTTGRIPVLPTRWQIFQGELQMWAWVISTDVTEEARYTGAPLAHPWARQPVIFYTIGPDHLRIGTGMGARPESTAAHLHFTFHRGLPVWDLQVLQSHPGGLSLLRDQTEQMLAEQSPWARRRMRRLRWILPQPEAYLSRFLGEEGWIARAEALDYGDNPDPGAIPDEFHSVVAFMEHCAQSFPEQPSHHERAVALDLAHHFTRRFRERGGFGWFGRVAA